VLLLLLQRVLQAGIFATNTHSESLYLENKMFVLHGKGQLHGV
jgi:hypothetical protein